MAGEIAVLYENEAWMAPLFASLDEAGLPYRRVFADDLLLDPTVPPGDALLVNKVSPSSYLRGHERSIGVARAVLAQYESAGVPVVNGSAAYDLELSKAKQIQLLHCLGFPHPRTRVANSPAAVLRGAEGLRYPILVKPNTGGSGALIRAFADRESLEEAADSLDFGVDGTVLVQELLPAEHDSIVRLEILDGEPLYAIRIGIDPTAGFNLCPADICQVPEQSALDDCVIDAAKQERSIEREDAPARVWEQGLAIARAARLDVCGIEYLVDSRTGEHVFYDINALSNFVTDAPRVVGFDPHAVFASYLARRAGLRERVA